MRKTFVLLTFVFLLFTFISCPQEEGIVVEGNVQEKVVIDGTKGLPINSVSLKISLTNGKFASMKKAETPVSSWVKPFLVGLNVSLENDVNEGDTSLTLVFSGTVISESLNTFNIEIPYQYFVDAKKSIPLVSIDTKKSQYKIVKKTIPSLLNKVEISGSTSNELESGLDFTLSIEADSFKSDLKTDVTDWFAPIVDGIKYSIKERIDNNTIVISASGTPVKAQDSTFLFITIPTTATLNGIKTKLTEEEMKGSVIAIEDTNIYRWKWELYDIAAFVDATLDSPVPSENRSLTTATDGSALIYKDESNALINSGDGKTVAINNSGLSRHGYRFIGWTDDPVLKNIKYKELNPTLSVSDGYKETERERVLKLYAMWEVNKNFYYRPIDISNGGSAIPGIYAKPLDDTSHIGYNYYNEITIPSEGYSFPHTTDNYAVEKATISYDFAVAEHPITGYMLDSIRSWAVTQGYEIPSSAENVPESDENAVGYGSKSSGGVVLPLCDASHPLTFVTVPQAVVIANALTAYYNAHKTSGASLDAAYVLDDGTEVKTIENAKVLVDSTGRLLVLESARGFRLPLDTEWDFVARVMGNSEADSSLNIVTSEYLGSVYPSFQKSKTLPGQMSAESDSPLPDDYSWYKENSIRSDGMYTTTGFTSLSLDTDIPSGNTLMSKYSALSLVRNMSGNIKEWTTPYTDGAAYRVRGGSFLSSPGDVRIGYFASPISPNEINGEYGIRFVRRVS